MVPVNSHKFSFPVLMCASSPRNPEFPLESVLTRIVLWISLSRQSQWIKLAQETYFNSHQCILCLKIPLFGKTPFSHYLCCLFHFFDAASSNLTKHFSISRCRLLDLKTNSNQFPGALTVLLHAVDMLIIFHWEDLCLFCCYLLFNWFILIEVLPYEKM